eukprot:Nk52_evm6s2284 gene=Nk52_evmTU6s2284
MLNKEHDKWKELCKKGRNVDAEALKTIFENIMHLKKSSIKGLYAEYIWQWLRSKLWTRDVKKNTWGNNSRDNGRGVHCPLCNENPDENVVETVEHINSCRGYLELADIANNCQLPQVITTGASHL